MSGAVKEKSAFTRGVNWCINYGFDATIRLLGPVMAAGALSLIALVTFTYFTRVLPDFETSTAVPMTIVGLFLLFNIVFNFCIAATISPGRPPLGVEYPPAHIMEQLVNDPDLKHNDGKSHRFCNICKSVKPMRTHHCSVCKRCTYKMDHHCPWLNNCVGYRNWRYFLLFLFYLLLGTFFFMVAGAPKMWFFLKGLAPMHDGGLFLFVYMLVIGIFVAMVAFLGWSGYLASTNQTTIEFWGNSADRDKRWMVEGWENPLDLGVRRNLEQIFGTGPLWTWIMPSTRSPPGDGVIFPLEYRPTPQRARRLAALAAAKETTVRVEEPQPENNSGTVVDERQPLVNRTQ